MEGHAVEGHAVEGHAVEGHAVEGHAGGGHAVEGHAVEGHAVEGHAVEAARVRPVLAVSLFSPIDTPGSCTSVPGIPAPPSSCLEACTHVGRRGDLDLVDEAVHGRGAELNGPLAEILVHDLPPEQRDGMGTRVSFRVKIKQRK